MDNSANQLLNKLFKLFPAFTGPENVTFLTFDMESNADDTSSLKTPGPIVNSPDVGSKLH